ncbi:hypothetical protein KKC60_05915 [Patescibacteria group bacterium]|nr:hypothetical protein [Patescibacteria group bacterium]
MGILSNIFGSSRERRKTFDDTPSTVKLWPTQIKKIMRRTYMKTVSKDEKEQIIQSMMGEARNGLTEIEFRRVLQGQFHNKAISKPDYNKLDSVFAEYYSGKKRI